MGLSSFITQDTHRSIPGPASKAPGFPVVMTAPDGRKWFEPNYQGYTNFGGKPFFNLVAEINNGEERLPTLLALWELDHDRSRAEQIAERDRLRASAAKIEAGDPELVKRLPIEEEDRFYCSPDRVLRRLEEPLSAKDEEFARLYLREYLKAESIYIPGPYVRPSHDSAMHTLGVAIFFGKEPFLSPNLTEDPAWEWENRAPETCPHQGSDYDDDDTILRYTGKHYSLDPITWIVECKVVAEDDEIDEDDPNWDFEDEIVAGTEAQALDIFHEVNAISLLENYEITARLKCASTATV